METLSTPDHSDFNKSKAALLSTSVILFLLSRVDLKTDTVDILGLQIGVEKYGLVQFWSLVVFYFLMVFAARFAEHSTFVRAKDSLSDLSADLRRAEERIDQLAERIRETSGDDTDGASGSEGALPKASSFRTALQEIRNAASRTRFAVLRSWLIADVIPPFVAGFGSIYFAFVYLAEHR